MYSELPSMSSTDGMALPFTLPSQERDSVFSRTPSCKSQLKISKKISPKEDLLVTSEEPDLTDDKSADVEEVVKVVPEVGQEDKEEEMVKTVELGQVEKAKTVGTEPTTVSMDTNTGSVDTQLVSKGTPANTPEVPFAKSEIYWSTQDVPVTNDNQHLEPITEDIENASFLKTPRGADSAVPLESTAIDKVGMGKTNDAHAFMRYLNVEFVTCFDLVDLLQSFYTQALYVMFVYNVIDFVQSLLSV